MKENEEKTIASVSGDGLTITLTEPLKYQHISIDQDFDGRIVESRAEVGLLTRNIHIRGSMNEEFVEVLPACDQEFNSGGAFSDAMQTCFAGKFGEELGSDEMGAIIILSPKYKDEFLVSARIEYTEFSNVGQAFRVGRYPIHFHLPGNMSGSYIRGNAIHHSNNRACTLHDVSNLLVEKNVAFNIKGLSFFLEDGVEQYNTLQYNLAIFTRMSNSLLNPDINPASFWIVNPNNKFRHNACAGGTHFCFWLRAAKRPDGPSFSRHYCPNKVPFDEFHNNTAHSMGWYGFWIFGQSNHATYDPHDGSTENEGYCKGRRIQTTIGSFTTWNNKRGFEIVSGANIKLEDQTHMDHDFAAYEIFTAKGPYGEDGPGINNAVIVGHSQISDLTKSDKACTPAGVRITDSGYTINNTKFFNFDRNSCHAMSMRLEEAHATATATLVNNVQFFNSPNKVFLDKADGEQGMWLVDKDGSLTGTEGASLVGDSATNPSECIKDTTDELGKATELEGHPGSVCPPSVKFHRMKMMGENAPSALQYNAVNFENDNGVSKRPWTTMLKGWEALLPEGPVNWLTFDSSEHVTNTSYEISVNEMHPGGDNYVLIGHKFYQTPDRFTVLNSQSKGNASASLEDYPTYEDNESGEWYFTNETKSGNGSEMVYILSDKGVTRKKRSAQIGTWGSGGWHHGTFRVFRCYYENCIPPPPPTLPPGRPDDFYKWSDKAAWEKLGYKLPVEGDTVFIPPGAWFVMDVDPPPLERIYLYGGLEISDEADHKLEVDIILIQGGKLECGTQKTPHLRKFELILTGNHYTPDQPLPNGPNLGAKALGVFGWLDMHGVDNGKSFVKLASSANAGDSTIELVEEVTWSLESEIVITSTSFETMETERKKITQISGTTITLDSPLEFSHTSNTLTQSGSVIDMSGEVGLLTKNVRIVGNDYAEIEEELFGARVLVGEFEQEGTIYTGSARFSNVEFSVAGQDGWYDNYDPRYALAYLDTGDSVDSNGAQKAKESYVKKCSFNYLYNSAIGVFGSNNVPVEDNVIYRFINNGIFDEGYGNRINRNLVTMGLSVAKVKKQSANENFFGCINNVRATNYTLTDNIIAGCEQAGLYTLGYDCDMEYKMSGNEIHSTMHGVHLDSYGVSRPSSGCVKFKDALVWKNYDYALYTRSESSAEFESITAIDNGVGLLPYFYGPSADAHQIEDKYVRITNSLIIASSDGYDCSEEQNKPDIFSVSKEASRAWKGRGNGISGGRMSHHVGVVWPIFQSAYGKRKLSWQSALVGAAGTNPALRGILKIENVEFANFGEACGKSDIVFRTNFKEDDVNWPIKAKSIHFTNVNEANKIFIDEPIASKINPADCTDFDCDGMKKAMIIDTDGSVSENNTPGTIIPNSFFEWDGNPARGLGYYRVPKPMITELDGSKIEYKDKMPNLGIYRDGTCSYNENWRGFTCESIDHRLLIIESMDRDTKIRRLSPIAMLANPGKDGFIDLVNGPQDFSCCSGYTCAERLSTFYTMVATGIDYEVMFTSIPPQNFRIHLPYNEGGKAVRLKIWFPKQQRLDVYVGDSFISPQNRDFDKQDYALKPPGDEFIPGLESASGSNYFDPNTGHLYLIIKEGIVNIKTQPVVVLKLGMTVAIDDFFEENVIGNLAGLLGIDAKNIRVTNIVREGSVRKKRNADADADAEKEPEPVELAFEIGPPPSEELVNFVPPEVTTTPAPSNITENPLYTTTTTTTTTAEWIPPENYMTFEDISAATAGLMTSIQSGEAAQSFQNLGAELGEMSVEVPIPPPEEPKPIDPETAGLVLESTFAEQQQEKDQAALDSFADTKIEMPHILKLSVPPSEGIKEMALMPNPISLYIANKDGKPISKLGGEADPWKVSVSAKDDGFELVGNLTVSFNREGLATFEDLRIGSSGSAMVLTFRITYPQEHGMESINAVVDTDPFSVDTRPLGLKISESILVISQTTSFSLTADIWDNALDEIVDTSVISGITWECIASLSATENEGTLSGTLTMTVTGRNCAVRGKICCKTTD